MASFSTKFRTSAGRRFRALRGAFAGGLVAWISFGASGCSTNAATGKSQLNFYSEVQEVEMGRTADREISAQMGVVDDPELQRYVSAVGQSLAAASERPSLPWSFKVMDDPIVNAFALPGGFIYVTRGILGHLTSEAELAAVLGHEIGHVTAQHSMNQMSKAQLAQGGLLLGMIVAPEVAQAADLAGIGLQALFLKYGRDDERQADDLGLRYMSTGGYETREMPKLFELLGEVSAQAGTGRIPNWLSSHPDPGARADQSTRRIAERNYPAGEVGAASYVDELDGLTYGRDPRQGYFDGGVFYHPELRFEYRFPAGWKAVNETSRVVATSPQLDAQVLLTLARGTSAEEAARVFNSSTGIESRGSSRVDVGGLLGVRSEFVVQRDRAAPLLGVALFVEKDGRVFELLGLAVESSWRAHANLISESLASLRPLTDSRHLNATPQRIQTVKLPRAMTFREFSERYPSTVPLDALALLNRVRDPTATIASGTVMKRVIGPKFGDG